MARLPMILYIIFKSSTSAADSDVDVIIDMKLSIFPIISYLLLKSSTHTHTHTPEVHPSSRYPMYWEVDGNRKLLLGGFDYGEPFLLTGAALTTPLEELVVAGGNYLRNTMVDFTESVGGTGRLHPFFRDTNGMFDLNQWNDTYWSQFDNTLNEAANRNIVVSIEFWDPWHLRDGASAGYYWWKDSPWSPEKNVNYTTATGLSNTYSALPYEEVNPFYNSIVGTSSQKVNMAVVLDFQKAFVKKVLTTTAPYNNVIFQIDNESGAPTDWVDFWADYINANSDGRYVTDMRGERNLDLPAARHAINNPSHYDFADASQNEYTNTRDVQYTDLIEFRQAMIDSGHPRPINQVKVYSRYNSSNTSSDLGIDRFFMDIFAGTAGVRFHKQPVGEGLSVGAKRAIKSARWLDDQIELALMVPITLNDSRWIYRDENEVYGMEGDKVFVFGYSSIIGTVFNPSGIKFDLRDDFTGYVQITWFNADTGEQHNGGTFDATSDWTPLYRPDKVSDTRWIAIVRTLN